jgi:PTH1 family peptidyl-tRNA hydrolase
MVIDAICEALSGSWSNESKLKAHVARVTLADGQEAILAKPQTFMNLSGEAAQAIAHYYKVTTGDIWILSDDLDLPFGRMRIRTGGGTGGHNGLKSLVAHLGDEFVRLRLGIGRSEHIPSEHYVLQAFAKDEAEQLPTVITEAANVALKQFATPTVEPTSYELL